MYAALLRNAERSTAMSEESFSVLMQCRADALTRALHVQIVHVDTGEVVQCSDSSFLLRMTVDTQLAMVRCLIRHIASGDEAYVQSGLTIVGFVHAHLLDKKVDEQSFVKMDDAQDRED